MLFIVFVCLISFVVANESGSFDFGEFFKGGWNVTSSVLDHETAQVDSTGEPVEYFINNNEAGGLIGLFSLFLLLFVC